MKLGDQDITYVKNLVGIFEKGWDDNFGEWLVFSLLVLGPPGIALVTYYYNSTIGSLGPYLLAMSLLGIWFYRILFKARPLSLEFGKNEISQSFRNGQKISVLKSELSSASIKQLRGGYILVLHHAGKTTEFVMNQELRKEFIKNA